MIIGKPLFTADQIQQRVRELADAISRDYEGKDILAIGLLRGAFLFFADLVRAIRVPLTVDFIVSESYVKSESSGEVKVHCDIREDPTDKDVLLVEDITDSGISLSHIRERILLKRPKSLRICTFLDKKERRVVDVPLDYIGFTVPNKFVVGYGMDYENKFRNLPYIAIFRKSV